MEQKKGTLLKRQAAKNVMSHLQFRLIGSVFCVGAGKKFPFPHQMGCFAMPICVHLPCTFSIFCFPGRVCNRIFPPSVPSGMYLSSFFFFTSIVYIIHGIFARQMKTNTIEPLIVYFRKNTICRQKNTAVYSLIKQSVHLVKRIKQNSF